MSYRECAPPNDALKLTAQGSVLDRCGSAAA